MSVSFMSRREFDNAVQVPSQIRKRHITAASSANVVLTVYETTVEIPALGGAIDVYLPSVAEAKGRTYHIYRTSATQNATVKTRGDYTALDSSVAHDDATNFPGGNYVLTAAVDFVILKSDGAQWIEIAEQTT